MKGMIFALFLISMLAMVFYKQKLFLKITGFSINEKIRIIAEGSSGSFSDDNVISSNQP